MSDTVIDVSLDTNFSAINFTSNGNLLSPPIFIRVPYDTTEPTFTIEVNREAFATWVFKKLIVWSTLHNQALVEIPTGLTPVVYDIPELSFVITNFSDGQILIENINKNSTVPGRTNVDITIKLETFIEFNGVVYVSKDPQVIDERESGG